MGVVGGPREYEGPGLGWAPWKCPACTAENTGPIDKGCTSCGAGSAQPRHLGVAPPPVRRGPLGPPIDALMADLHLPAVEEPPVFKAVNVDPEPYALAETWAEQHPEATIAEAFVAGYRLALQLARATTMQAPPVTADIEQLAPAGKVRRTIIAALDLFKDQVLRDAETEVASGEWCSVEEVEQLLAEMRKEESHG